jgi:signal peptidase I
MVEPEQPNIEAAPLTWRALFFSFDGRISRRTYVWRGQLPLSFVSLIVFLPLGLAASAMRGASGNGLASIATLIFIATLLVLMLWMLAALAIKRLHDRNRGAWFALVCFVPVVGLWLLVELLRRGTVGANRYDAAPRSFVSRRTGRIRDTVTPGWTSFFIDLAGLVLGSVVLSLLVRTVAFEPFNIPAASMTPTLLVGDYFFVSKYSYGWGRYSFAVRDAGFEGRFVGAAPRRGDIVIFRLPRDPATSYVKRIVGVPGDRVQMVRGALLLNGEAVPRVRLDDFVDAASGAPRPVPRYHETLPGGPSYDVLQDGANGIVDNTQVFEVPAGSVFVLGDFRSNSLDSRIPAERGGVGLVPYDNLVGRAEFRFFSAEAHLPNWPSWPFWHLPLGIRWSRILTEIR